MTMRIPFALNGISPRMAIGVPIAVLAVLAMATQASAVFDPYKKGTSGYDFSYPQCGSKAPASSCGVVGINGGYPFTYYNTCLAAQFAAAAKTGNAAVYINTGYDPSYTAID